MMDHKIKVSETIIEMDQEDFSLNLTQPNAQGRGQPDSVSIHWDDIPATIAAMTEIYEAEK